MCIERRDHSDGALVILLAKQQIEMRRDGLRLLMVLRLTGLIERNLPAHIGPGNARLCASGHLQIGQIARGPQSSIIEGIVKVVDDLGCGTELVAQHHRACPGPAGTESKERIAALCILAHTLSIGVQT